MYRIDRAAAAMAAAAALLAAGCGSSGMGGGEMAMPRGVEMPVLFSWHSDDGGRSGEMTATLPEATYQGPFFEIHEGMVRESLMPLWDGWPKGWDDWPFWAASASGADPTLQFVTRYTGKVVANLRSPSGQAMRCRLHLREPTRGMAGGGDGECQIAGGRTVQARF